MKRFDGVALGLGCWFLGLWLGWFFLVFFGVAVGGFEYEGLKFIEEDFEGETWFDDDLGDALFDDLEEACFV